MLLNRLDSAQLVTDFVAGVVGTRDVDATVRARLRRDLTAAIATAREGDAQAMFLATEIAPGLPMPVTLTVYAKPELRMSPAVGTAAGTVVDVLLESFELMRMPHLDTAARLSVPGSQIVRLHHVDEKPVPETPGLRVRTLVADYWFTVPGSKHIAVANFSTPLGDIPRVMLDFFDSIVRAAYFEDAPALSR